MKIWLDDLRNPPDNTWWVCRTASYCIQCLKDFSTKVDTISLDHDLGNDEDGTGYDVVKFLEEQAVRDNLVPQNIKIHSANPVGRQNMQAGIDSIKRIISCR